MKNTVITGFSALFAGIIFGWLANHWRMSAEIESLKKDYAQAQQSAERKARETEKAMQSDHDALRTKHEKEKKNAESEINALRTRVRSGAVRLSVPAPTCAVPAIAGTGIKQTRTELDPTTAENLISIAEEGDNAIRELNLCIDQYSAARNRMQ